MIHDTAIIHEHAKLGRNVSVGPFSVIHANVEIADNVTIGSQCELGIQSPLSDGSPLIINESSTIRSHSVFYESSQFGRNLTTGHRVTVRENTRAGEGLQIGTLSDFQGHCTIGDHVRTHSNVHIGQESTIGDYVWIFPYVVLTNDPHPPSNYRAGVSIEDFAVIATMSVVLPGVTVGKGALVGSHSNVTLDVADDVVVVGNPAKEICKTSDIKLKDNNDISAYPWRKHFHRGYPEAVVKEWIESFE